MRNYTSFIIQEVLQPQKRIFLGGQYPTLNYLNTVIFDPVDEVDQNLVGKGIDIRRLYFDRYGIWPKEGPCSMLEMMAGLAMSCDEMLSPDPSNTTPWNFFNLIFNNLLTNCNHFESGKVMYSSLDSACTLYRETLFGEYGLNSLETLDIWSQANRVNWEEVL